jgi:hypothetical protein
MTGKTQVNFFFEKKAFVSKTTTKKENWSTLVFVLPGGGVPPPLPPKEQKKRGETKMHKQEASRTKSRCKAEAQKRITGECNTTSTHKVQPVERKSINSVPEGRTSHTFSNSLHSKLPLQFFFNA